MRTAQCGKMVCGMMVQGEGAGEGGLDASAGLDTVTRQAQLLERQHPVLPHIATPLHIRTHAHEPAQAQGARITVQHPQHLHPRIPVQHPQHPHPHLHPHTHHVYVGLEVVGRQQRCVLAGQAARLQDLRRGGVGGSGGVE